jgi:hypothetical protein
MVELVPAGAFWLVEANQAEVLWAWPPMLPAQRNREKRMGQPLLA